LCDTYIENSKAIFDEGSAEEKESAAQTLYTAIEGGLLMIHPFMPFLTVSSWVNFVFWPLLTSRQEELWQRLPRREGDTTPSITVAAYPEYREDFADVKAAEEYELLVGCAAGLRSLTSEYAIKDSGSTTVQALDDTTHAVLTNPTSLPSLRSLSGKTVSINIINTVVDATNQSEQVSTITILSPSDPAPTGCAVHTIGSSATAFLDIKGRIDIDKEIAKAKDRLKKNNEVVEKQRKLMDDAWEEKVSEGVKEMEREKLRAAEVEGRNWEKSIEQFERLKIE
jgi:valyl-tRNA synthetase